MDDITIEFSETRQTWNVFVNGEWYFESKDYEQALDVYFTFFCGE